ncbi:MAG: hypothetical protein ACOVOI_03445 [Hyphomicrobiales bacterium]
MGGYLSQDGEAIKAEGGVWRRKMHRRQNGLPSGRQNRAEPAFDD